MDEFIKNCRALLEKITMQHDANWIAFSGGLDSSILGQIKKDQDLNALTIIAKDFIGTDLSHSQIIGKHIGIPLELKYVSINEMLEENTKKRKNAASAAEEMVSPEIPIIEATMKRIV